MLVDLDSSLGLVLGDLDWSRLDELCLDMERLIEVLEDLLDLDLLLGESLPPELAVSSCWISRDRGRHRKPWIFYN